MKYIEGVVSDGTILKVCKVFVRNYQTHTATQCIGEIASGPHTGRKVLINSLVRDRTGQYLEQVAGNAP